MSQGSSCSTNSNPYGEIPPQKKFSAEYMVAIASGKGGVGKSTVAINTAYTLARKGYKVGLLDADIYGPSIGKMLGISGPIELEIVGENKLIPLEKHGIKVMSFSFLIEDEKAIIWRGPMLGKALEQFFFDIQWGQLDFLIIDLPPGTGDVQLSLAQLVQIDGAVIVSTPQKVALLDAGRAINMFESVKIPVLGVIENMSEFVCPHCGEVSHIFSQGGGKNLASDNQLKILGEIPLTPAVMESGEKGIPLSIQDYSKAESQPHLSGIKAVQKAYDNITENIYTTLLSNRELTSNLSK